MQRIHSGFLKLALTAMMLLGTTMVVTPAMAAQATFSFTGVVDYIDGVSSTGVLIDPNASINSPTSSINGSYTFNIPSPNSGTPFSIASYNPVTNLNLLLGPYSTVQNSIDPTTTQITVLNDFSNAVPFDGYIVSIPLSGGNTIGGTFNGNPATFIAEKMGIELITTDPVFSSNALPTVPPSLQSFALNGRTFRVSFIIDGNQNGDRLVVGGTLATLVATPLPPAVILFGAGLVALIGLGARRRWQASSIA